ncbi:cell wall anchor protein, partial [Clavibacter lycopersici]
MVGTRARHAAEPSRDARGPRSRPGIRRLAALVAAAVGVAAAAVIVTQPAEPAAAAATPILSESFGGASVTDPAWKRLGSACLTGATAAGGSTTLASCPSRVEAPAASTSPGFLQLTDARVNAVGGAVYDTAIPVTGGLDVTFDQYQYSTTGSGEGITFFLADGAAQIATTGAGDGSLGYAQSLTAGGLPGAYLGVALDAAGRFSTSADGKGQGCSGTVPSQLANTVALRGGATGYCYLTRGAASTSAPLRATATSATAAAPGTALGRSIRITVSNATLPVVTVFQGATAGSTPSTRLVQYTMTSPIPSSVKLGFTAATGATTADTHLVRNLSVTSIDPGNTSLELIKAIDTSVPQTGPYVEGSVVRYAFAVRPTGLLANLSMSNVTITDPLATIGTCSANSLLFPGSTVCTGTRTVTAAEAMSGRLRNTATATATLLGLGTYTSNVASLSVAVATPAPGLTLAKTGTLSDANGNGRADVGERIAYSFTARNSGNVSLYQVAVADPRVTGISPASVTLAPGASQTFTSTAYTVTQADVDAATPIVNTATVSGKTLAGVAAPTASSSTSTPVNGSAALSLTKGATLTGGSTAGATVAYSFSIRNTGTVPLTGVALTDPLPGLSAVTYAWPGTAGTLAPGATATATASYTVRQADVDAGQIANTATVRGASSGGVPAQATATRTVTLDRTATLAFTKTATPGNVPAAGGVVTYAFRLQNTGSTTLTGVSIADPRAGVSALAYTWPGTAGTLAPGQVVTATATYTVTAADVTAGSIVNTATASATAPTGAISRTATATVLAVPDPLPDSVTTPQGVPVVVDVLANDGPAATGATLSRAQLSATPTLVGGA